MRILVSKLIDCFTCSSCLVPLTPQPLPPPIPTPPPPPTEKHKKDKKDKKSKKKKEKKAKEEEEAAAAEETAAMEGVHNSTLTHAMHTLVYLFVCLFVIWKQNLHDDYLLLVIPVLDNYADSSVQTDRLLHPKKQTHTLLPLSPHSTHKHTTHAQTKVKSQQTRIWRGPSPP